MSRLRLFREMFPVALSVICIYLFQTYFQGFVRQLDFVSVFIIALGIAFVVHAVFGVVASILSSTSRGGKSLAFRMMTCPLRHQYGLNYCAVCPEGYECASGGNISK